MSESLYAQVPIYVYNQVFAVDLNGVNLQAVEGDLVTGVRGGPFESFAEQVSGIYLHAGRDLVAEEWIEEKIQLLLVGNSVQARIAKADDLAFGVGRERDFGGNGERQPETGSSNRFAEAGMGFDAHDDAVLGESEFGVLDIGEAGGLGVAFEVIAAVGSAKELLFEGALDGVAAHLHFDGVGWDERVKSEVFCRLPFLRVVGS